MRHAYRASIHARTRSTEPLRRCAARDCGHAPVCDTRVPRARERSHTSAEPCTPTYAHVPLHAHTHTCTRAHTLVPLHAHTRPHAHPHMCAPARAPACPHTPAHVRTCSCPRMATYAHVCPRMPATPAHVRTYTRAIPRTHAHTPARSRAHTDARTPAPRRIRIHTYDTRLRESKFPRDAGRAFPALTNGQKIFSLTAARDCGIFYTLLAKLSNKII